MQQFRKTVGNRLGWAKRASQQFRNTIDRLFRRLLACNGLKLQRSFSGLGESCQPAVSKPYRKEIFELKLQHETLYRNQHFRDAIKTSLVNLAKIGSGAPGAEAAAALQLCQ